MAEAMTWEQICDDPLLQNLPHRIEQDRFGRILMTPPAGFTHVCRQTSIMFLLGRLLPGWQVLPVCPIRTKGGVRAPDVVALRPRHAARRDKVRGDALLRAPAICVEVMSPRNRRPEIEEKRGLCFEIGCEEFWICTRRGELEFWQPSGICAKRSRICPSFPLRIEAAGSALS
jgi:Uma2 family endonuclease